MWVHRNWNVLSSKSKRDSTDTIGKYWLDNSNILETAGDKGKNKFAEILSTFLMVYGHLVYRNKFWSFLLNNDSKV